jgi:hypothetical protein
MLVAESSQEPSHNFFAGKAQNLYRKKYFKSEFKLFLNVAPIQRPITLGAIRKNILKRLKYTFLIGIFCPNTFYLLTKIPEASVLAFLLSNPL